MFNTIKAVALWTSTSNSQELGILQTALVL